MSLHLREAIKNKPDDQSPLTGGNPYKGLKPYEESDNKKFFGRLDTTDELFQRVKLNLLLVVFGKAGIGKSSVLNAGVFPKLRNDGYLPIAVRLNFATTAASLVEQIYTALDVGIEEEGVRVKGMENVLGTDVTLWEYFHRAAHFDKQEDRLTPVLLLDQFEDLFNLGKYHSGKKELLDQLYWLVENQFPSSIREQMLKRKKGANLFSYSTVPPDVRIIISLREEYLPHLNQLKSRISSIDRAMYRVTHLNGTQAREIIGMTGGFPQKERINEILKRFYPVKPAGDPDITEQELEIEPSFLSLLCFQLFETDQVKFLKDTRLTTKKDQDKILGDFYNSAIKKFPKDVERYIETNLLTKSGTRQLHRLDAGEKIKKHINLLIDQRVLRKVYYREEEHIEIIHDVLAPVVKEKRDRRKRRKSNIVIAGLLVLLFFVSALAWYAFDQKSIADIQRERAEKEALRARSYGLAAISENLRQKDPTLSFRLAQHAYQTDNSNPNAYGALLSAYYSKYSFYQSVLKHTDNVNSAVFSPDGQTIVTAGKDKMAILWNLKGEKLGQFMHNDIVKTACFSPDGKHIITEDGKQKKRYWDLQGDELENLPAAVECIKPLHKLQEGEFKKVPGEDVDIENIVQLTDVSGKVIKEFRGHTDTVNSFSLSPDRQYLLTAANDAARLWRLNTSADFISRAAAGTVQPELKNAISPDKMYRVSVKNYDNIVNLVNTKSKRQLKIDQHQMNVNSVAFSPAGNYIVTASMDQTARLWNLEGVQVCVFRGHRNFVNSACFSPDGNYIITAGSDKTVRFWDLNGIQVFKFKPFETIIRAASFSSDGKYLFIFPDQAPALKALVDAEMIIQMINAGNVWQLDEETKVRYNLHKRMPNEK